MEKEDSVLVKGGRMRLGRNESQQKQVELAISRRSARSPSRVV